MKEKTNPLDASDLLIETRLFRSVIDGTVCNASALPNREKRELLEKQSTGCPSFFGIAIKGNKKYLRDCSFPGFPIAPTAHSCHAIAEAHVVSVIAADLA
jgi:hypothetical protein